MYFSYRTTLSTFDRHNEILDTIDRALLEIGIVEVDGLLYDVSETALVRATQGYTDNVDSSIPPGTIVRVLAEYTDTCTECGEQHYTRFGGHRDPDTGHRFCSSECLDEWMGRQDRIRVETSGGGVEWLSPDRLMPYNSIQRNMAETTCDHPYLIGFEVEKEDCEYWYRDEPTMVNEAVERGWLCVSDGSLDEYGFELVSPAYNLTDAAGQWGRKQMQHDLKYYDHLDAGYSDSCGGHITVSKKGYSGAELVDFFGDFAPLLFALYPSRLRGDYAYGRSKVDTKSGTDKFRAINCQNNRVEFRIFSAVRTGEQLEWRTRLIREAILIAENGGSILDELLDKTSPLAQLLREIVNFFQEMLDRFMHFRDFWNHGIIDHEIAEYFEN